MLKSITIKRFKAVQNVSLELHGTDVLIGGNNSGKSSALQAIQFAVSVLQTLKINNSLNFKRGKDTLGTSLSPEQLIYSPIKDVYSLLHGAAGLREGNGKSISIKIETNDDHEVSNVAEVTISKGRNKNIAVSLKGATLCNEIANIDQTFSMYVPGLAGIPFSEEIRPFGSIRRALAKGDSNTILRNVLYQLQQKEGGHFDNFLKDIQTIFPDMTMRIDPRLENDGVIEVFVTSGGYEKPIDAMGTGVLQIFQIYAYVNLFAPRLLLLDEPDSHLHPNNQKLLAQTITRVAEKNCNVIIATHSRHLVGALRKNATITLMKKGEIEVSNYNEYDILMEIGALDEYDVFRNPEIKYIIATEDVREESNKLLKCILESSGFSSNSFFILPYEGCSKVHSVLYLSKCLQQFRPDLKIVIHRDRDGMNEAEVKEYKQNVEMQENTYCFITKAADLEVYFCDPEHIFFVTSQLGLEMPLDQIREICRVAYDNVKESALKKFLNRRLDPMREGGRGDISLAEQTRFMQNKEICTNGHLLMGNIASQLHAALHISKNQLEVKSPHLADNELLTIAGEVDRLNFA